MVTGGARVQFGWGGRTGGGQGSSRMGGAPFVSCVAMGFIHGPDGKGSSGI